jgi:hypothetical protein
VVVNGNLGCYGNAVKDAESHAFLSDGMMARGPYNCHSRRQLDEKGGFVYTLGEVCCTYKIKPLTLYKKDTSIEDASFCHIQLQYLQIKPLTLYKKDTSIEDASFCHIQLQYLQIKPLTLYKKDTSIEDASFCHIQLQYLQMRDSCWNCPIFKAGPTSPCRTFSVISITLPAARRAQGKISL